MPASGTPTPDANALLVAAGVVLAREGLDGLTVRKIAKEAGTTTMAIYSRLGGKDGVLNAINQEGFIVLNEALKQAIAAAPERPANRISAICRTLRNFAAVHPHHYRVMLGTPPDGYTRDDPAQDRARALWIRLREHVAAMVGEDTASTDTYALFALCHGLIEFEAGPMASLPPSADGAFNAAIANALHTFEARAKGDTESIDLLSRIAADAGQIEYADLSLREVPSRNAPCPCGSGKRYKHCHGAAA